MRQSLQPHHHTTNATRENNRYVYFSLKEKAEQIKPTENTEVMAQCLPTTTLTLRVGHFKHSSLQHKF
jgi:hypothetical protein